MEPVIARRARQGEAMALGGSTRLFEGLPLYAAEGYPVRVPHHVACLGVILVGVVLEPQDAVGVSDLEER